MHWFYAGKSQISDGMVHITGADVNHIKNVLRMEPGESVVICDGEGVDYYCSLITVTSEKVTAAIQRTSASENELNSRIYLFQGIPKKDKMEFIIQKAVELGVYRIIPVAMKRCVAKVEEGKKEEQKRKRWNGIAEAAAKQSGRGIIPDVYPVMSFPEAYQYSQTLGCTLIPYEQAEGIEQSYKSIKEACTKKSIGVFIGPEGGFDDTEITLFTKCGITPVTLGKRILRTETAGMAVLSILMFELEKQNG